MKPWLVALSLILPVAAAAQTRAPEKPAQQPVSISGYNSADYTFPEVHAVGHVLFQQGQKRLLADEIFYNLQNNTGMLTGASFTTCELAHPDYRVTAREIQFTSDQKLKLTRARLYIGNFKLLSLPKLTLDVSGQGRQQSWIPRPGYSKRDGFFVQTQYTLTESDKSVVNLKLKPTVKSGFQGGVDGGFALSGGLSNYEPYVPESAIELRSTSILEPQINQEGECVFPQSNLKQPVMAAFGAARLRERVPDINQAGLLVTKLPEIGLRYITPEACFGGVQFPQIGIQTQGRLSFARIKEDPGDGYINRFDGRGTATTTLALLDKRTALRGAALARYSSYDTGDSYSVLGGALDISRLFLPGSFASIRLIDNFTWGTTPLESDNVDIRHEVQGAGRYVRGRNTYDALLHYDLDRSKLRDWEFSIAHRLDCLEPRITWRNKAREISVSVKVLGL